MISYDEFKEYVMNDILGYLPETYANADVRMQEVIKNNDVKKDGLTILREGMNISPTIYLDDFFEAYKDGTALATVMSQIARIYEENAQNTNFDISLVTNFNLAKDKVIPRLVNAEENKERLKNIPHSNIEDLTVIYTIELSRNEEGVASITVNDSIMSSWGVSLEELDQIARENLQEKGNPTITDMKTIMIDMMTSEMLTMGMSREDAVAYVNGMIPDGGDDVVPMYVVTNKDKINGANVLLDQEFMDKVAGTLGGDFYVLPSSIHECICIPKNSDMESEELENMVREVNATQVAENERLSDHVYEYNHEQRRLQLAGHDNVKDIQEEQNQNLVNFQRPRRHGR